MKVSKKVVTKIRAKQKEKDRIYKLYEQVNTKITKEEMHRLKKALKEGELQKLKDWAYGLGLQLDNSIAKQYNEYYEKKLKEDNLWTIKCMETVLIYTLHFNEKCKFGGNRIKDFMDDFTSCFELITNKECNLEDYIEQLKAEKIEIE